MFLAKDHVAFDTDRRRLAVWADIRHLHWGLAQRREYRRLQQHGRTLQRKWLGYFTPNSIDRRGRSSSRTVCAYALRGMPASPSIRDLPEVRREPEPPRLER